VAGSIEDRHRLALPDGNILILGKDAVVSFTGGGTYWRTLSVEKPKGETVLRWNPGGVQSWPTGRAEIAATLMADRERVTEESRAIEARMKTLGTDQPDVWSLLDFLYFSVMTQATVGYGDIIPNSTEVRIVVVLQVLCGYVVLVVLINWVVATRRVVHAADPQPNEGIQPPA
jgi:ion channel